MVKDSEAIQDVFGRSLRDLRISVIDKCNFRCTYCMPKEIFGDDYAFLPKEQLLRFDEIVRTAQAFAKLGVQKIRITGGEPLLRKNLTELVYRLKQIPGIHDIALTTNALLLTRHAEKLKQAGLKRVNISLDAFDDDVFGRINGKSMPIKPVLRGIQAAKEAGLEVKINMVVKKGMNDDQILPMARYFKGKGIILRYIEFMDVGNHNDWEFKNVISKQQIIDMINEEMPIEAAAENYYGEVASRFKYSDGDGEIGVISSVTDSFCGTCTRIRLSADGKLFTCLFASTGYDIRESLRQGLTDEQLEEQLKGLWEKRTDRYSDERATRKHENRNKIEMSYIGG